MWNGWEDVFWRKEVMRSNNDDFKKESDYFLSVCVISLTIPTVIFTLEVCGYDISSKLGSQILLIICLLWLIWVMFYD